MIPHQIDFSPGSQARGYIQKEFFTDQSKHFITWFITTYLPLFIKVLERSYKDGSGNITKAIYPPQSSFVLPNNTGITFTAFQKFIDEDVSAVSIAQINKLISQNNYLSLYVKVLGEQISFLDKKLDNLTVLIKEMSTSKKITDIASTSGSKSEPQIVVTHIQRPPEIQDFKFKSFNDLINSEVTPKRIVSLQIADTLINPECKLIITIVQLLKMF